MLSKSTSLLAVLGDPQQLPRLFYRCARKFLAKQDRSADRVEIAPKMDVQPVFPIGGIDRFSVPDHPGHHAEDHAVRDAVFPPDAVVPQDNIVTIPHLDDPAENILVPSCIPDDVVFFAASLLLSDLNQIPALAQQGKHGDADISINKISLFVQQVFQGIYFFSVCLLSLSLINQRRLRNRLSSIASLLLL